MTIFKSLENIYDRIRNENPINSGDFNARSPVFWEGDTEAIVQALAGGPVNIFIFIWFVDIFL